MKAKVLCHSENPAYYELITLEVTFPRFILAEWNTYGSIAKNASSSRAINTKKYRERVENDPSMPVWWGKQQEGMSAAVEVDEATRSLIQQDWDRARHYLLDFHRRNEERGLHKQLLNRALELWAWVTVVATANLEAWQHLLFERNHPDAQPEFRAIAIEIERALEKSTPTRLEVGQWHLPYIYQKDRDEVSATYLHDAEYALAKISSARCARASYLTQHGVRDLSKDVALFEETLVPDQDCDPDARPGHYSPTEHPAQALSDGERSGRFQGFKQMRKMFPYEFHGRKIRREYPHREDRDPFAPNQTDHRMLSQCMVWIHECDSVEELRIRTQDWMAFLPRTLQEEVKTLIDARHDRLTQEGKISIADAL
jgi:hypothetical protein